MAAKIRLYVNHPLGAEQTVPLSHEQAHYAFNVMRLAVGDAVLLFNSQDGEWSARVIEANKRKGVLVCDSQTRGLVAPPDLWLMFAPIKKARTDFIVEKATEMGAARICPVKTDRTNSQRIRRERLKAHAIEAAEQCGGTFVPDVDDLQSLGKVLDHWPAERNLMFCDEELSGARRAPDAAQSGPWAILIGPEGGFSPDERARLVSLSQAQPVSLGPRILRADTAAVAALTLWQLTFGDWT